MKAINVLWLWIVYFSAMGARDWYLALHHYRVAEQADTQDMLRFAVDSARSYHWQAKIDFALACAAYVAWFWVSGQGR